MLGAVDGEPYVGGVGAQRAGGQQHPGVVLGAGPAGRVAFAPTTLINSGTTVGIGLLSAASASMAAPSRSREP